MRPLVYRADRSQDWQDVELVGRHRDGRFILRERGKQYPGVWLASADQVRVPAGVIEVPEILRRYVIPEGATPGQRWKYKIIRQVCGRDEALRQVFGWP